MYSQYIPHFPTLWLTKDERSLLYKYFILNPSLCCISSIVSSHLQILYIVQKKCWSRQRACVLVGSSAAPEAAALLPGRDCKQGSLLLRLNSTDQTTWSPRRAGCGHPAHWPHGTEFRQKQEQEAHLWLCQQKTVVLLPSALDLGENERVKRPLC